MRGGTPRHARTQAHAHAHKATHTHTLVDPHQVITQGKTWSGPMAHAAAQACMYTHMHTLVVVQFSSVVVAAAVVVMVVV